MQVTRTRRERTARFNRSARIAVAGLSLAVLAGGGAAVGSTTQFGQRLVGQTYSDGLQISSNQVLKPMGERLVTELGKFMGSTVSPDGRFLVATSNDKNVTVQVFDLEAKKLVWTVGTDKAVNQQWKDKTVGQEGPTFSPDGKFVWVSQLDAMTRFPVNADGSLGEPTVFKLEKLPAQNPDKDHKEVSAMPAQSAYGPDGLLYVALNGQNKVIAMDPVTGFLHREFKVGIAPRQLAFVGKKLYVSNEGGRHAMPGEAVQGSYGTNVPADPFLSTSTTGTVSVINTARPKAAIKSIKVGLHPTAMLVKGRALFVTNVNDDSISVIDTKKNKVVQTVETRPYAGSEVGYHPSDLAMTEDGRLLVTLSRANAIAVYDYAGKPQEPMGLVGLVPTDYYPSGVFMRGDEVVVANTRGIDARGPELTFKKGPNTTDATGHATHATTASLTWFDMPSDVKVRRSTDVVFAQNGWKKNDVKKAKGKKAKPVAVPKRLGDPSKIKHVFLLVKENRTYDQVLGDDPRGRGDKSLTQFGEEVTPNTHELARQFGLFDNTYDTGTNSAEGHSWLMQGDNPQYTELSAGEYKRSYDSENDVLGHQRSGFIWTSVLEAGKSAKNYGEFMKWNNKPEGATWQKYYCATKAVQEGKADPSTLSDPSLEVNTQSPIPSLNDITVHNVPMYDTNIPDIYRFEMWKQDFRKAGPANFNMLWLSSDHTGGAPDPRAQVADNDLAVGQIVEEISRSKYWKDSAIFVVEDDSQNGADHVDGHRAPVAIISPYSKRGAVNSRYYTQINMMRTIQQILGAEPLNQKLAAATPMYDAFTNKPNYAPYTHLPNRVPLTEEIKEVPECGLDVPKKPVAPQPATPATMKSTKAAWDKWAAEQPYLTTRPDVTAPALMNRWTWYNTSNFTKPYPGDKKILTPKQVPGAELYKGDTDE